MRVFNNFTEAFGEIKRDLKEMGILVHTKTMQDKDIDEDPKFETYELMNYIYTVTDPSYDHLNEVQPWAIREWEERLQGIHGNPVNPGEAYKLRLDVWKEFLEKVYGQFSYTYSKRLSQYEQVKNVIARLRVDSQSRQLYIGIWNNRDSEKLGRRRVPCSLGYHFMCRDGKLHVTYFMRSCDFNTHLHNDIYLALKLRDYVAEETGLKPGRFTHFISSFHVYRKDVKDVF